MAAKIYLKRSSVSGNAPNTSILDTAELALNLADGILYSANSSNIFEIGSNLSSIAVGANNFVANSTAITTTTALTVGAITIPNTDGSNAQVLITDGNGTLSFADAVTGADINLVDLADVTGTVPADGQIIKYATANSTFYFADESAGAGAGGISYVSRFETSTANGTQVDFSAPITPDKPEDLFVTINGVLQAPNTDYTVSGTTVTFDTAPLNGQEIVIRSASVDTAPTLQVKTFTYSVNANTTTFTGGDDNSQVLSYIVGNESVYLNGVKLILTEDYTSPNSTHIVLTDNAVANDVVEVFTIAGTSHDLTSNTVTSGSTSQLPIDRFAKTAYRSSKYFITANTSNSYHTSEALVIHDGTTSYITEYGIVITGSELYSLNTDISGDDVRLLATPAQSGTTFKTKRILTEI